MTRRQLVALIVVSLMLPLGGCGKTHQAPKIQTSGFLNDYSQLEKGGKGEAQLIYLHPDIDLKDYDRILMEPVRVYVRPDTKLSQLRQLDIQDIINYLDSALREQLKGEYQLVDRPGPGVMRMRVAITEAEGGMVVLDTISSVTPIGLAINGIKRIATGTYAFTGQMGIEVEFLDSQTDTRLVAAVDRRAGEKISGEFDKFNKWRAVQGACDYWAVKLRHRLAETRWPSRR
jgi:hypothetical protein